MLSVHFIHAFLMTCTVSTFEVNLLLLLNECELFGMCPAPSLQGPVGFFNLVMVCSQKSPDGTFFQLCHGHTYFYRPVISREDFKSFQKARHHPFTMSNTVWSLKSSPSTSLSLLCTNIAFALRALECRTR